MTALLPGWYNLATRYSGAAPMPDTPFDLTILPFGVTEPVHFTTAEQALAWVEEEQKRWGKVPAYKQNIFKLFKDHDAILVKSSIFLRQLISTYECVGGIGHNFNEYEISAKKH